MWPIILSATLSLVIAFAGTATMIGWANRRNLVDRPNERSSHSVPTPRLGGIPVLVATAAGIGTAAAYHPLPAGAGWMTAGFLLIAAISLLDDLRDLPALPRLLCQIAAVVAAITGGAVSLPEIPAPTWLVATGIGIAWLWFINLYNFMDGIDGITAVESLSICAGLIMLAAMNSADAGFWIAIAIAASVLGFAFWNWHPAKIFLGDTGSIPLGYLLGWLLLMLAAAGEWAAAIILPAYYLADASITLVGRGLRGEKFWQAHRGHFYQRAHQRGLRHDQVVLRILVGNVCLIGMAALAAKGYTFPGLSGAAVVVALLLWNLYSGGPTGTPSEAPRS